MCDELTIHSTIEEEIVYPALRQLNAGLGSALAVLLFLLVLPGMAWRAWLLKKQERR